MYRLIIILFFCGCIGDVEVIEKYVCPNGWVVDDVNDCVVQNHTCPKCIEIECPKLTCPKINISCPELVDSCILLGCPYGTKFVASVNSDKYHDCTCHFAKRISEKNRVCYEIESQALLDGKRPSDC